jgi:hypothetical protein
MAVSQIFAPTQNRCRARALSTIATPTSTPTTIQPGVPVRFADGPAVSLTASGNGTVTQTSNLPAGLTSITYENGGASLDDGEASFAFDGTFEFAVTGATTSTASGVEVYITTGGTLTLTVGTNTHYGWTDYPKSYRKEAGRAPVRIGA